MVAVKDQRARWRCARERCPGTSVSALLMGLHEFKDKADGQNLVCEPAREKQGQTCSSPTEGKSSDGNALRFAMEVGSHLFLPGGREVQGSPSSPHLRGDQTVFIQVPCGCSFTKALKGGEDVRRLSEAGIAFLPQMRE